MLEKTLYFASGEFVLKKWPNGGTAVFYRSLWVSTIVYLAALAMKARLPSNATWSPDLDAFRDLLVATMAWFGIIFSGIYAALYARFASQWNYLADLYNQLMASSIACPPENAEAKHKLRVWQAAFLEDAEDLHLSRKPMFAAVIRSLLMIPEVREIYIQHTAGGEARLRNLETCVEGVISQQGRKWPKVEASDQTLKMNPVTK